MTVPSYQSFLYQNNGGGADYASPAHSPTHMMSPSQPIPTVPLLVRICFAKACLRIIIFLMLHFVGM